LPELEYATVEHFLTGQSAIEHEWLGTHYFDSSSGAKAARAGSNDAERYSATKKISRWVSRRKRQTES
jgi:hypothetical protein